MLLKDILNDVTSACTQRWPDAAAATRQRAQAEALIAGLDALKPSLKQARQDKQACARRFGQAKAAGINIDEIKLHMQRLSAELDSLEAQRKAIETELCALFADSAADAPLLPQQFGDYQRDCAGPVSVAEAGESTRQEWDRYVGAHPLASLYHRYCWRDIVSRSFGHSSMYLIARTPTGDVCGVLPLVRLQSRLFGDFAISMPFFNYGGPLVDNRQVAVALFERAAQWARASGVGHLELRATRPLNDWPSRTDKVSMIRTLPASVAVLDEELGTKVRAQIKRGQQENPISAIGGLELLDEFYRVFAINMRDLGTPVYTKSFFRNILVALPGEAHLVVIRLHGKPVAAAFLLGHRDMMEIPWASTLRSVNALNMNMVLYRAVLGFCIERGYRFFDFGRSTQDAGTFKFKKQWGAVPVQHYWHYWLRQGGELPALKPDSPKFRLLVACWQKLPVPLANLIGPPIVKNLP